MELKARICPICGSEHIVDRDGKLYCRACGVTFEREKENDEAEQKKLISFVTAENDLKLSPPHFEDAADKFEQLIREYKDWYAPYWGYVRAKYNIKYETDAFDKAIPSCYDGHYQDFRNDKYFKKAVELADSKELKNKLLAEGDRIARTWKEWESRAQKENYDIFLSFKATDDTTGGKTEDVESVRELYNFLSEKGYKVFFSPVSMKKYFGEPFFDAYIYNALEKSKVLIVYGSKPEYFTATWVENEWTRYLRQMQDGKKSKRSLLIAYKGFNPSNELPVKLHRRQGFDASLLSFSSDLLETIKEIFDEEKPEPKPAPAPAVAPKPAPAPVKTTAPKAKVMKEPEPEYEPEVAPKSKATPLQPVNKKTTKNYAGLYGIFGIKRVQVIISLVALWIGAIIMISNGIGGSTANLSYGIVSMVGAVFFSLVVGVKLAMKPRQQNFGLAILGLIVDWSITFYSFGLIAIASIAGNTVAIIMFVLNSFNLLTGLLFRKRGILFKR